MSLSEHDSVVGMAGTVSNPELLAHNSRRIDGKFLSLGVVDRSSLHLGRVVSITKLSEAEASHALQAIDLLHEGQMAFRMQSHEGTSEQVELDGEFSCDISIDLAEHLVSGENILWVVLEVKD